MKIYALLAILALIACMAGVFNVAEGIRQRGWDGVNYGRILFPLLVSMVFFRLYKKKK